MAVDAFVQKQLLLLDLEEKAEVKENELIYGSYTLNDLKAEKREYALLQIEQIESGMCNRKLVTLRKRNKDQGNLFRTVKPGDLVLVGHSRDESDLSFRGLGVLAEVKTDCLTAALNDASGLEGKNTCYIFKITSFKVYKQMRRTLDALLKRSVTNVLINVLFAESAPTANDSSTLKLEFFNSNLNTDQKEAVKFALCQKEVAVLHGPPGTGKTTTIVEIILQFVKQGLKVLACAPSNVAVDNLVEGLAHYTTKIVRLGHPARVLPNCHRYNLDFIIDQNEDKKVIKDVEEEIAAINTMMESFTSMGPFRKSFQGQRHQLQQEINRRRGLMTADILKNCDVVTSTLTSAYPKGALRHLPAEFFDVVIIDECSQALEVECWIPLLYTKRCVLAGDHLQLPPVICSSEAAEKGLAETLMERVLKIHGADVKKLLTIQYRMHKDIMHWSSEKLYENQLKAHESVASHRLCDLPNVEENKDTSIPLLMIDTAGAAMHDYELQKDDSKGNEGEAQLVAVHVESLVNSGLNVKDIAVITPYNLQVDLVKMLLLEKYPGVEVRSVDGFQGREKEAVVLSLVRSNIEGEVGFLHEFRRLNVAITRARRHLAVICDSSTVSHNSYLKCFVNYMQEIAETRSAFQYLQDLPAITNRPQAIPRQSDTPKQDKYCSRKSKKAKKSPKENKDSICYSNIKDLVNSSTYVNGSNLKREKYQAIIEKFIQSGKTVMEFLPDLSSYDRMIVHEIAEQFDIIHKSEGVGVERHIILMKRNQDVSEPGNSFASLSVDDCEAMCESRPVLPCQEDQAHPESADELQCSLASCNDNDGEPPNAKKKNVASNAQTTNSNSELSPGPSVRSVSSAFDHITNKFSEVENACQIRSCRKKLTPAVQSCQFCKWGFCLPHHKPEAHGCKAIAKAKGLLSANPVNSASAFDDILKSVSDLDNSCQFPSCSNTIKYLLQTCLFCNVRFCLSHHQPEVHGCGAAAKAQARSMIRKEGKLYPGSGKPKKSTHLVEARKANLEKKMQRKLTELSDKRKPKNSKK